MAETMVLKACAINRNVSPGASSAKSHTQLSGPLPVVQVNMTANGPQPQGGQIKPTATPKRTTSSDLPMVHVNMTTTGPQPQRSIATAPRVAPRAQAPRAAQVQTSPMPQAQAPQALTADQLLLCRHLVDKYLGELRTSIGEAQPDGAVVDNVKLAETTISAIDVAMIARTTAEAAVIAAVPPAAPPPRVITGSRSVQANAVTPRRVARPAPPPVIVKMDDGRPVLQTDQPDPSAPPTPVSPDQIDASAAQG